MKKIYVVGGATNYADFMKNITLVNSPEEADVVLFTGGEDVNPSIYGCKKHRKSYTNLNRDKREKEIFDKVNPNQLCVGVCRGSQLMCALNGGILVQDCENHGLWGTHGITNGKVTYQITSTHHQMQYPYNLPDSDYTLLYISDERRSGYYEGDKVEYETIVEQGEPEVVLYHKEGKPKCLAIQGHPEMMPDSAVSNMLNDLIDELLNDCK